MAAKRPGENLPGREVSKAKRSSWAQSQEQDVAAPADVLAELLERLEVYVTRGPLPMQIPFPLIREALQLFLFQTCDEYELKACVTAAADHLRSRMVAVLAQAAEAASQLDDISEDRRAATQQLQQHQYILDRAKQDTARVAAHVQATEQYRQRLDDLPAGWGINGDGVLCELEQFKAQLQVRRAKLDELQLVAKWRVAAAQKEVRDAEGRLLHQRDAAHELENIARLWNSLKDKLPPPAPDHALPPPPPVAGGPPGGKAAAPQRGGIAPQMEGVAPPVAGAANAQQEDQPETANPQEQAGGRPPRLGELERNLLQAVKNRDDGTIRDIIDWGKLSMPIENIQDKGEGLTVLALAAWEGSLSTVKTLLEAERKKHGKAGALRLLEAVCDKCNYRALLCAVVRGHTDIVLELLRWRADTEVEDTCGNTPLELAADKANIPMLEALLTSNADINHVPPKTKETAFNTAVRSGFEDAALLLLGKGADFNVKTPRWGKMTVMEYICRHKMDRLLEELTNREGWRPT